MLTESSYLMAIYVYAGAALALLLCLAWWLRRRRAGWVTLVVLLGAALLLTPAYPRDGVTTLAPALIVAGFQFFIEGPEAAEHALRPLATMSGVAVGLALLLSLAFFRRRKSVAPPESDGAERQQ